METFNLKRRTYAGICNRCSGLNSSDIKLSSVFRQLTAEMHNASLHAATYMSAEVLGSCMRVHEAQSKLVYFQPKSNCDENKLAVKVQQIQSEALSEK
jgi:hypothetical protein